MAASRLVAGGVGVATVALAVAGVGLAMVEPPSTPAVSGSGGVGLAAFEAIVYSTFAVLGLTVTARQPRNPVGWLLQLIALSLALNTVGNHVYYQTLLGHGQFTSFVVAVTWLLTWLWILAIVPAFVLLPLLFPTGRLLSPAWRPLLWAALVAAVVLWVGTAFVPGPLDGYPAVVSPVGIDSPVVAAVGLGAFLLLVAVALAALASAGLRFRRSTGTERQQLKWVALSLALLPFAFSGLGFNDSNVGYGILLGGLLVVAIAVAVAMLRYRLYDIDVVINRTLVYGTLTAILAAAYFGLVLVLQVALSPLTERSDLAVAGSTLAVAGLFRPARARIQAFVNRRFYRNRYDAGRTLAAYTLRLREQLDLRAISDDLADVVQETVQPKHFSLWLRH